MTPYILPSWGSYKVSVVGIWLNIDMSYCKLTWFLSGHEGTYSLTTLWQKSISHYDTCILKSTLCTMLENCCTPIKCFWGHYFLHQSKVFQHVDKWNGVHMGWTHAIMVNHCNFSTHSQSQNALWYQHVWCDGHWVLSRLTIFKKSNLFVQLFLQFEFC